MYKLYSITRTMAVYLFNIATSTQNFYTVSVKFENTKLNWKEWSWKALAEVTKFNWSWNATVEVGKFSKFWETFQLQEKLYSSRSERDLEPVFGHI